MIIRVSESGNILLEQIFNEIVLVSPKETLAIAQRDGKFEVRCLTPTTPDVEAARSYRVVDTYGCDCGTCKAIRKIQRG